MNRVHIRNLLFLMLTLVLSGGAALGQSGFTYQGKLTDGGTLANGNYDLQFALFDATDGTNQIGQTKIVSSVPVSAGVFTVTLDFGPSAFPGAARFLEISARPSGGAAFTLLTPRQQISSTPYAVRSLSATNADTAANAQSLGGLTASNYAQTSDPRLVDARFPLPGSMNYIQNTTAPQPDSNFNISGNGLVGGNFGVGTTSPQTKLHVVGQDIRVESNTSNMSPRFSWVFSGAALNEKKWNAYATARELKFASLNDAETFDRVWLQVNRVGSIADTVSIPVDRVGIGDLFTTPQFALHIVDVNPQIRVESRSIGPPTVPRFSFNMGQAQPNEKKWQTYAAPNAWIFTALNDAESQEDPWLIVSRTGASVKDVLFPRGVRIADDNGAISRPLLQLSTNVSGGTLASFGGKGEIQVDSLFTGPATRFVIKESGRVGIGTANPSDTLEVFGTIRVDGLGLGGSSNLCLNNLHQLSGCSSSLRYKTDLHPFTSGLNLINRLHPLTFRWKAGQSLDLGLGAEDVAAVEPLLVTHNEKGEVEGVKYDRLSAVFINAFKEQQAQIERQQAEAKSQQTQIAFLRSSNDALNARLRNIEKTLKKNSVTRRRHSPR